MYPITPNVPRRCVHCAFLIVSTPEGSIEISTLSNKDPEENVDAIEENIYAIEENIDAIEENIDAIEDNIDAIEENIDAIEENIDAITRDNSDNDSADDLDVCEKLFEQTTTCSRLPYNPNNKVKDIHDSKVWKQFLGPNGKQHTACSFNLTFGLYTDAINPYRNQQASKHTSIRFLILICLTLPNESRFLPENVFLAGIAPSSCEPSLKQINWILRPLIQQLKTLWEPVFHLSKTHQHAHGQQLCGALLTFLGDLPAV
ncbi:hypothetical protein MJO29_009300 [Puccinia striiformis f. sp. tritici]|nr:hypothetical protein MJO29_009300 [Puccinia striiformis f. sp. tritici]